MMLPALRYQVVPTPLTRLKWWRVVLDEAQAGDALFLVDLRVVT
jgi:hypothetical protein